MTKLRILHVEDDPDILEISRIALETIGGHEVHQFSGGAEAIGNAAAIAPDVFLLDVMMPGMSGEQTLAALRQLPECRTIPAIFMTAKAQENEVTKLRAAGAIDVIVKPFDPMALAAQIEALLAASKRSSA
jgi:CheY-like chemotaxis protein